MGLPQVAGSSISSVLMLIRSGIDGEMKLCLRLFGASKVEFDLFIFLCFINLYRSST